MLNYIEKGGFNNRKKDGLPKKKQKIEIIVTSKIHGDEIFKCLWLPFHEDNHSKNDQPRSGFLGTARITSGKYDGIGFHAWEQSDAEFIYYKILN